MAALPGVSQEVTVGTSVFLDGSASGAHTYCWAMTVIPDGYAGMLVDALTATPSFVAAVVGGYVLTLERHFVEGRPDRHGQKLRARVTRVDGPGAGTSRTFNSLGVRAIPA